MQFRNRGRENLVSRLQENRDECHQRGGDGIDPHFAGIQKNAEHHFVGLASEKFQALYGQQHSGERDDVALQNRQSKLERTGRRGSGAPGGPAQKKHHRECAKNLSNEISAKAKP